MPNSRLMSVGTSAMFAAYAQLQTTSNNIANANTPGYSRQSVRLAATEGQFTGSGFFGRGVTVQSVERAANQFLNSQVVATRSTAAADAARSGMLTQLEDVFGSGEAGLGYAATQLFNAYADLAAAPTDLSARQAVLARIEDIASLSRSNADQLDALQANVYEDVINSVSNVNELAKQVASLNDRIIDMQGLGQTPNDLYDQREQLIREIADKIEVTAVDAGDGSVSVFIAGGQSLVLGAEHNTLVAQADPYDSSRVAVAISVGGKTTPLRADNLGGGAIAGLLQFQNEDLAEARGRLGQIVSGLAYGVNEQQSFGLDLNGNNGGALFSLASPTTLAASTNTGSGSVALAITDASALQGSEYLLENDPANAGMFQVTRLSDGVVTSNVASGDVIDGMSITVSGTLGGTDSFLLQPVTHAAATLTRALSSPMAVAAANPLTAAATSTNAGTVVLGALTVVAAPASPYQSMTLVFTSDAGDWSLLDSGGSVLSTGTWTAGTPFSYDGFELALSGSPALNDSFTIDPTTNPRANNGNALAMDALASVKLVDGASVSDSYAQLMSQVGIRVQGATSAAKTSATVATNAQESLDSETGVNLDEEAARLIEYQQAYQAAAKMLQTAQSVLETLMQLGGQ